MHDVPCLENAIVRPLSFSWAKRQARLQNVDRELMNRLPFMIFYRDPNMNAGPEKEEVHKSGV